MSLSEKSMTAILQVHYLITFSCSYIHLLDAIPAPIKASGIGAVIVVTVVGIVSRFLLLPLFLILLNLFVT
jgi:hypothetical protein